MSRLLLSARDVELIHTAGGERWSATCWDEITGSETVGSPDLITTDDLLMLTDRNPYGSTHLRGFLIGRPLE